MAEDTQQQALALNWVFGSSASSKHSVVNLSDGYSDRICYLAANTAIIYDKRLRRQVFLQGHTNPITCIATTEDRAWVITADTGPESLLVVWNVRTGQPLRTVQRPHPHGICALDVSADSGWLATASAPDPQTGEQEVALWSLQVLLSDPHDGPPARPLISTTVPAGDPQMCIRFSVNSSQELISNGKRRVYFWSWAAAAGAAFAAVSSGSGGSSSGPVGRFQYYSPPLRSKDFKQSVGDFVMSVFVPGTTQALTGTSDGDLVVWDEQGITAQVGTSATDRRAIKLMRVHNTPVTLLATVGDYIVSGGEDGYVRFFDPLLRIVAWFEDLAAGPVTSVAFSAVLPERLAYADAADTINRFMVPDFVVATRSSALVSVSSATFEEYDAERRRGAPILDSLIADVVDIAAHPARAEFSVLGRGGTLQRWDSVAHLVLGSRTFERMAGSCLCYSRDGSFMVVGFESGHLNIISTESSFEDVHTARNTPAALTRVAASSTGQHIAAADDNNQVLLYAYLPYKGQASVMRWEFLGKARSHHAPIASLVFGESPSGQTLLLSAGSDGRVVEYDLAASSTAAGLRIASHYDFPAGTSGVPTSLCFAPPLQYFKTFSADTHLLVSDDSYKIRLFNPAQQAVDATFLGPTFGGPIAQLIMFKSSTSDTSFLAYRTAERVVGLIAWPLDGDPARTMGLIAHPGDVRAITISYDGRKLLTAGADGTIASWDVSSAPLERSAAASEAQGESRWAAVVGDPDLLEEMRDYFMYAQVKAQGEDALEARHVPGTVPVEMVPDLMRAAGYYPSEADITNLLNHVQYMAHSRDVEALDAVSFADLLCLYVNHRPLFNVSHGDIVAAFKDLGARGDAGKLQREQLLSLLQAAGEPMSPEELAAALRALTGATVPEKAMPPMVNAQQLSGDVLGFDTEAVA